MKYVAFLRAINVGGHVVKMDVLKKLFEQMGFRNVETFIASGNVIFDARTASEKKIEDALKKALGYEVRTFLRTPAQLQTIAATNDDGGTLYVGFMAASASEEAKKKLQALSNDVDDVRAEGTELYWLCRAERYSDATITNVQVEKALGQAATLRNISTVRKLAGKYS
ncbi:MAG TPA: DUF1697 domain-containing protein [Thermoanaerobaculia bacterium]|nr:DUF1697 domain-containing protein [Thermoanaerobaculia bacterium]